MLYVFRFYDFKQLRLLAPYKSLKNEAIEVTPHGPSHF